MPRNVRNFWLKLDVDGRKTRIATGPQSADGGFVLNLFMRKDGEVTQPVTIWGLALPNGVLALRLHLETERLVLTEQNDNARSVLATLARWHPPESETVLRLVTKR